MEAKVFCTGDRCDNDPNEYMLCKRWQSGHPICRGDFTVNYADWRDGKYGDEQGWPRA
jgi:hypothetical protein